jgi:outer membrane protein TolC
MRNVFAALRNISWGTSVLLLAACARAPEPFDADELSKRARSDFDQLQQIDAQAQAPLSLYDAIARALKYNRERKLAAMEVALGERQLGLAQFDMSPSLTASAGYSERDKFAASASTTFSADTPAHQANLYFTLAVGMLVTLSVTEGHRVSGTDFFARALCLSASDNAFAPSGYF